MRHKIGGKSVSSCPLYILNPMLLHMNFLYSEEEGRSEGPQIRMCIPASCSFSKRREEGKKGGGRDGRRDTQNEGDGKVEKIKNLYRKESRSLIFCLALTSIMTSSCR